MKLYVKVIAFSEEDGVKATREEVVEISPKVEKLTEAVMGDDPEDLVNSFATSALIAALQTVQMSSVRSQMESNQMYSGPIGGRPEPNAPPGAPPKVDPLAKALGLDVGLQIIEAMDRKEHDARAHEHAMRGGGRHQPAPASGPGPIGFGPHRGR